MNHSHLVRLSVLAVLTAAGQNGIAQTAPTATVAAASAPGKAGVVANERVTAVVAAIDQTTRKITLRGADGALLSFTASPEVRNLAQVKIGDTVTLSHTTALVLELKKTSGGIRERVETEGAARAAPGQMPGAVVGREVRVVADVISIDAKSKTVRLRGPQRTVNLRVDDPQQLAGIKVGDQVEATFVDAVALVVEPGAKPATK